MSDMVEVKFNKNYIASRGPGIAGAKGSTHKFRMTDALHELIVSGVVELVKAEPAATRKKATGKKGGETA